MATGMAKPRAGAGRLEYVVFDAADMTHARASRHGLPVTILALAGCVWLLWLSVTVTMARSNATANPKRALAWSPADAAAQGLLAASMLEVAATASQRTEIRRLAVAALRRDPTIVSAARTLGLLSALEGERNRAVRLLAYAQTLSRRDVPTQLWFIQQNVATNNLAGALEHFDIALRTSAISEALLMPVLVSAVDDPAVRRSLVVTLARKPIWGPTFLYKAIGSDRLVPVVALAVGLASRKAPMDDEMLSALMKRLVASRYYDAAATLAATVPGGANIIHGPWPNDGGFDNGSSVLPFEWTLAEGSDLAVERVIADAKDQSNIRLAFSAISDVGGEVARQLMLLRPGSYEFASRYSVHGEDRLSQPYWRIVCVDAPDKPALQLDFTKSASSSQTGSFSIPAVGCRAQWLTLFLRASQGTDGIAGWVDDVGIRRAHDGTHNED
jgi:hypothetical protein